eukprot:GHVS01096341.1.p2 GENE.GHVS01096341.1~~GHVS01096341.1.p2  ORF type:complete len:263 (+),score=73.30 GHVS01096341.1:975-1763(+)
MHRLYQFPLREGSCTDTKDAVFMPSGWDTADELMEYASTTAATGLQKPYETLVTKPVAVMEYVDTPTEEMAVEKMSEFLNRLVEASSSVIQTPPQQKIAPLQSTAAAGTVSPPVTVTQHGSGGTAKPTTRPPPTTTAAGSAARFSVSAATKRTGQVPTVPIPAAEGASDAAGDSASLQTFFQGLLAKGRGKAVTTPRARRESGASAEDTAAAPDEVATSSARGGSRGGRRDEGVRGRRRSNVKDKEEGEVKDNNNNNNTTSA